MVGNDQLAERLALAAAGEEGHRRRALGRAARAALLWPEEAAAMLQAGRRLSSLAAVGPWVAGRLEAWIDAGDSLEPVEPPPLRRGFLTRAQARGVLSARPDWRGRMRADLQVHTLYSDGHATAREMAAAALRVHAYESVAITDHSQGLRIANGMSEQRLEAQGIELDGINGELAAGGGELRLLRAIEMNLSPEGDGDMEPAALSSLDLVLGAFHSQLRVTADQTDRYRRALRNRTINVLAHPRGRRYDARLGLQADWRAVFEEAADQGVALEIDAYVDRQDLDVELLRTAAESGCLISIGSDAHHPVDLASIELGLAAALLAGIEPGRIVNFMPRDRLLTWARERRSPRSAA